ncbi:triosephosphate isomerase [Candidatus Tenderia electrophaga]|uniref:Triosephosphate isomerase n=1 Tax=Candidatus Tenderia electrophaga TaxID=1748243 RepID=A0A0S2TCF2_9GAMM|nr:triosephosphate isomerase [Candidatus Tenderia electrophaga]
MRKPLVAGNWKMNGSRDAAQDLIAGIRRGFEAGVSADVAICPPFVYLTQVGGLLDGSDIALGGQNVSQHESGAYTGEVAPAMLADVGCEYVILGHSERRSYYGEDDALVADKVVAAHAAGLKPILCVGETLDQREADRTEAVVASQLDALLNSAEGLAALKTGVIAYEPVWAIGTGKTASPQQAQDMHAFIRQRVAAKDAELGAKIRILYGGSVKGNNAAELFAMADIDGGLIGGASLQVDEFLTICQAAQ